MKRDKNFYLIFIMICFAVFYVTSFVLLNRTVSVGNLIATASIFIYPITYFIATLFAEKYGKDKLFNMLVYSVVALLFCALIIFGTSLVPIYNNSNGVDVIFNIDFRLVFAFIAASLTGQFLNITIYYFLDKKKSFNFLISSVIAITVDSLIFVALAYIGELSFIEVLKLFSGQYVLSVVIMVLYALCFAYLINSLIKSKKNDEDMESLILNNTNMVKVVKDNDSVKKTEKIDNNPLNRKVTTKNVTKNDNKVTKSTKKTAVKTQEKKEDKKPKKVSNTKKTSSSTKKSSNKKATK